MTYADHQRMLPPQLVHSVALWVKTTQYRHQESRHSERQMLTNSESNIRRLLHSCWTDLTVTSTKSSKKSLCNWYRLSAGLVQKPYKSWLPMVTASLLKRAMPCVKPGSRMLQRLGGSRRPKAKKVYKKLCIVHTHTCASVNVDACPRPCLYYVFEYNYYH